MHKKNREWSDAREEKRSGDDGEKKVKWNRGKKSEITVELPLTYAQERKREMSVREERTEEKFLQPLPLTGASV